MPEDLLAKWPELAGIPEHSLTFMEAMSRGQAFVCADYAFLAAEDWLMAIGYPLRGSYSHQGFNAALSQALAKSNASECWAIAPELPPEFSRRITDTDQYYILPASAEPPAKLKGPLAKARQRLTLETGREFSAGHRRLWAEFLNRAALKPNIRELFSRTEAVLNAPGTDLRLLNAWDEDHNLAASLLVDFAPHKFCSYLLGAHSKTHYTAHAGDLVFALLLEEAGRAGKEYIHLGLGVNEGIRRFKVKWGGRPGPSYVMAHWQEGQRGLNPQNGVTELMRVFLQAPSGLSKAQIMASLPEQRHFAMLWELQKNNQRSWIGGSAHFFCYSFEFHLRRLFEKVDTVIFEGPLDQYSLDLVARAGQNPPEGAELVIDYMNEEDIRALEWVVQGPLSWWDKEPDPATLVKVDVRRLLAKTRPWYAFFTLWTSFLARRGWRQSVDLEAWNVAMDMGKMVVGVESIEEQLATLDSIPMARIVRFLSDCRQWTNYMRRNVKAYLAGDLSSMLGTSTEFPSRTDMVINMRDQRLLERMDPFLEQGRAIGFVGTAHMLAMRDMLRRNGYSVNQVMPTWRHKILNRFRKSEPF